MADTVRIMAFRPNGDERFFDRRGKFCGWVRLVHDAGRPTAEFGHKTGKPSGWNVPGGQVKHHDNGSLLITASREAREEGVPDSFTFADGNKTIPFEKHLISVQQREWARITRNHQIVAFLFVEKKPIPIENRPDEPLVEEIKHELTRSDGSLECDLVGWWHINYLPLYKKGLYFKAQVVIKSVAAALESEQQLRALLEG